MPGASFAGAGPRTRSRHFPPSHPVWPGGHSEGPNTRSHPELGRENPQRRWYCTSRCGRVGRRQARNPSLYLPSRSATDRRDPTDAGWSSPVARQAHNLKVVGSNPTPATISTRFLSDRRTEQDQPHRCCRRRRFFGCHSPPWAGEACVPTNAQKLSSMAFERLVRYGKWP